MTTWKEENRPLGSVFRPDSIFWLASSRWHSSDLGGIRMSSWAVPVSRAPSLRLLDRHRPVKGVKLLHCMYRLSVKCAFSDDAGPSQALRAVIGPCFCNSGSWSRCDWARGEPITGARLSFEQRGPWGRSKLVCGSRSAHTGGRITAVTATLGVSRQTVKKANKQNGECAVNVNFACVSLCVRVAARCFAAGTQPAGRTSRGVWQWNDADFGWVISQHASGATVSDNAAFRCCSENFYFRAQWAEWTCSQNCKKKKKTA